MTTKRLVAPSQEIDEYRLVRPLGHGGMGQVFLAHDTLLDRPVAVKFVAGPDPDPLLRERFYVEARALARLSHPNVVTVYRVGELRGRPFLVYEFVRGQSLDKVARPVTSMRALELGLALARGLAAAHRRGVLHRDIKPANAMVAENGDVKLLDFGLAKLNDPGEAADLAPPASPAIDEATRSAGEATVPALPRSPGPPAASPPSPASRSPRPGPTPPGGLTEAGAVMGTPHYMAPEIWRGEVATRRSDVYSLGALLYELCVGRPPHDDAPIAELRTVAQTRDAAPLARATPRLDPRLAAIIDRCLQRDPDARFATADELRDALEHMLPSGRAAVPEGNPYRGLGAFEQEHRALFFGRGAETREAIDRLRHDPLVVVVGESGVGKSSLCRAGVVPLVIEGALEPRRNWRVVTLVPGRRPVAALATALAPILGLDEREAAARLAQDAAALAPELRVRQGDHEGLLLFVDQLEELVTTAEPGEAIVAAELIAHLAVPSPSVRVLSTVRADFLGQLARLDALRDELAARIFLLGPLTREGIREAIVEPARSKGVRFESEDLIETLARATAGGAGALPLLQFALATLWNARRGDVVTHDDLEGIGGVTGALARHADQVLAQLAPAERGAARKILVRLVTSDGTRTRRTDAELGTEAPEARAAVDALVRGRILVARNDVGGAGYEVAHEALLTGWATLRGWLVADVDRRLTRERIASAAADWERLGRPRDALWGARQLRDSAGIEDDDLASHERGFVVASRRALRRGKRLRTAALVGIPAALLTVYGAVRLQERRNLAGRVDDGLRATQAELTTARAMRAAKDILRSRAFAAFDAARVDEGEIIWARARAIGRDAERAYGRAAQQAETAVMLDGSRSDARSMLAEAIYERALLAEADHASGQVDELLRRLSLYDDGARRRAWDAPASLVVATRPERASVRVERWVEPDGERGRWLPVDPPRQGSNDTLVLEPGSYVFTSTAPGHAEVRYPVRVGRGEALRLDIDLPRSDEIPEGFVFVPPLRFLIGSTAEEGHRRDFEKASPLHERRSDAFLVARHETTFAEWIAFLEASSDEERRARTPAVSAVGHQGSLSLTRLPAGGWQLELQPATTLHRAREHEPIEYPSRAVHRRHDWHRMPVSGISLEDARAYAAWMRQSGRLAGGRLCRDAEWELAARGADGRPFPTGNRLDPDDANFHATYGDDQSSYGPDQVGLHPSGRSVFGLDDVAGNVFELTADGTARGGAFPFDQAASMTPMRNLVEPTFRDSTMGVRLCADHGHR